MMLYDWKQVMQNKEVIEAFCRGERVQVQDEDGKWKDIDPKNFVTFAGPPKYYRIAPKTRKVKVRLYAWGDKVYDGPHIWVDGTHEPNIHLRGPFRGWLTDEFEVEIPDDNATCNAKG